METVTLNDVATLLGVVAGTSGLVLGILNHLRDRFKLRVILQWDMSATDDPERKWGNVTIANVGRRPVSWSHLCLKFPSGYDRSHLLIASEITATRFLEGDPPRDIRIPQNDLEKYAKDWKKVRAQVTDAGGREWLSKPVRREPSWAKVKSAGTANV